jgi:hypothetical protein
MAYINKMDRTGADFFNVVHMMKDRLNTRPVLLQLPIGAEDQFSGLIDLVEMHAIHFNEDDKGINPTIEEIPAELADDAEMYRAELVEAAAEYDDALLEKFLAEEEISVPEIKAALARRASTPPSRRWSAAPRSRTRACSRCSTRSSTTCPRRSTSRPSRAMTSRPARRSSARLTRRPPSRRWRSRS